MKDLSKLQPWEQKKQMVRTEQIDQLLEVIGSGLPFRCKIVIDVSVQGHPSVTDYAGSDPTRGRPSPEVAKFIGEKLGKDPDQIADEMEADHMERARSRKRGPTGPQGSQPNKQGIPHCAAEPPDDDKTLEGKARKRRRNLTESEVAECRWLKHERGWSVPTIADRMDIPEKTVYRLIAGRSYPKIEPARPSWYDDETYDDTKPEGVEDDGAD